MNISYSPGTRCSKLYIRSLQRLQLAVILEGTQVMDLIDGRIVMDEAKMGCIRQLSWCHFESPGSMSHSSDAYISTVASNGFLQSQLLSACLLPSILQLILLSLTQGAGEFMPVGPPLTDKHRI